MQRKISIEFAYDYAMLRKGLIKLLKLQGNYTVSFKEDNGDGVMDSLKKSNP